MSTADPPAKASMRRRGSDALAGKVGETEAKGRPSPGAARVATRPSDSGGTLES
jgi:hypothetical protein